MQNIAQTKIFSSSSSASASSSDQELVLVLGGTGKTGRRIVDRLRDRNVPVRVGSRSAPIPFDWQDRANWSEVLAGVTAAYIAYTPDLASPGADDAVRDFTLLAKTAGVRHIVLLSGRGEPEAELCERIVQAAGMDWTIVRCAWFNQNFTESFLAASVAAGVVALPVGEVKEPFVDVEDIADVAVAALTESGHTGELYELTGPRLLSFPEVVAEFASATDKAVRYEQIPHEAFLAGLREHQVPEDYVNLLDYLFGTIIDGRNAHLTDGVQRALGRAPRDFADYARSVANAADSQPAAAV